MPIKIPDSLPAREMLLDEDVDLIDTSIAQNQDIRPLKFLLLNLMLLEQCHYDCKCFVSCVMLV